MTADELNKALALLAESNEELIGLCRQLTARVERLEQHAGITEPIDNGADSPTEAEPAP